MKKIQQLILLLITQFTVGQVSESKTIEHKSVNNDIVQIEIDTIKYKPTLFFGITYIYRSEETDESINIDVKNIRAKDTINNFQRSRNEEGFLDLGKVDGLRTIVNKQYITEKGKDYIAFSYAKLYESKVVLFTALAPSTDFIKNEETYKKYARSMKLKK